MERGGAFIIILTAMLIFLTVTLLTLMVNGSGTGPANWSLDINDMSHDRYNIYAGDDGTLYTISGKTIYAIDGSGNIKWRVEDVDPEGVYKNASHLNIIGATSDQGYAYITLSPSVFYQGIDYNTWYSIPYSDDAALTAEDPWSGNYCQPVLLAISPEGKVLWHQLSRIGSVQAKAGRVYVGQGKNESSYDRTGKLLWTVGGVHSQPAIDEAGTMYTVHKDYDNRTAFVKAYRVDGTLAWSKDLADYGYMDVWQINSIALVYNNGTVYIQTPGVITALEKSGDMRWQKGFGDATASTYSLGNEIGGNLYSDIVFDSRDRMYVSYQIPDGDFESHNSQWMISMVYPNGTQSPPFELSGHPKNETYLGIAEGIAYYYETVKPQGDSTADLDSCQINAYDMNTDRRLWNNTLEVKNPETITLNRTNTAGVIPWVKADYSVEEQPGIIKKIVDYGPYTYITLDNVSRESESYVRLTPGNDQVNLAYWAFSYDNPIVLNSSTCTYAGGIYALDRDGKLNWSRSTDAYVTVMGEQNGTVYYMTRDGRISAEAAAPTTGALAAAAYVILRLLAAGTVARARSKLDENQNRNAILESINRYPGQTQHEIARHLEMNLGTVRYHLLILILNHKITAYTDDTKFVRYFRNSQSYSTEEKQIIALARREPLRRLLGLIKEGRYSSNLELARELKMPESAVSKYLRELQESGVIARRVGRCERPGVFEIEDRYREAIRMHLQEPRVESEGATVSASAT